MSINQSTILRILRRAFAVCVLAAITISAFAILGDKDKNVKKQSRSLLTNQNFSIKPGFFSLKSNYNFRGNHIINNNKPAQYIKLNTVLTYQKGNTTYIVPLKKKIYITTHSAGFTINH
jgi:hypothetical protein